MAEGYIGVALFLLLFLPLQALSLQAPADLTVTCQAGYTLLPSSLKCVKYYPDLKTWQEAEDSCVAAGGHLVSIHSKEDQDAIEQFPVSTRSPYSHEDDIWIGLSDIQKEGTEVWTDGTAFDYDYFHSTEPNDDCSTSVCGASGSADCFRLHVENSKWMWGDKQCHVLARYICQTGDAETTTPALVTTRNTETTTPPLVTTRDEQTTTPPLVTTRDEQTTTSPLVTTRDAQTTTPPLVTTRDAQTTTPPLVTTRDAQTTTPPLVTTTPVPEVTTATKVNSQLVVKVSTMESEVSQNVISSDSDHSDYLRCARQCAQQGDCQYFWVRRNKSCSLSQGIRETYGQPVWKMKVNSEN